MERLLNTCLLLVFLFALAACGGRAEELLVPDFTPEEPEPEFEPEPPPPPPELLSIDIEIDTEVDSRTEVPVLVFAYYDDNSRTDITGRASYSISPDSNVFASVFRSSESFEWVYFSNTAGQQTLTAEFEGESDSVEITVNSVLVEITREVTGAVLPLNATFPLLEEASAFYHGKPSEDILGALEYESLNTDIAVIEPQLDSTDEFVFTKDLGKFDVRFSYDNQSFIESFEVLPFYVANSNSNGGYVPALYALAVSEQGDSFFLSNDTVDGKQYLVLTQYSLSDGVWLDNIRFELPESASTPGISTSLKVSENKIVIYWQTSYEAAHLLIYDRVSRVIESAAFDLVDGGGSSFGVDNAGRVIFCKSVSTQESSTCITYVDGHGWSEEQFPGFLVGRINLDGQNIGYRVTHELDDNEDVKLLGIRYQTSDSGITLLDTTEIDSGDIYLRDSDYCNIQKVARHGSFICYGNFGENRLYSGTHTISYYPSSGWQFFQHLQPREIAGGTAKVRLGTADNGDVLLLVPISLTGEYLERHYSVSEGWGNWVIAFETVGGESASLDHDPVYTAQGWKQFVENVEGIRTRQSFGNWSSPEMFQGAKSKYEGGFGRNASYLELSFANDGRYALSWRSEIFIRDVDGNKVKNSLLLYKPILN